MSKYAREVSQAIRDYFGKDAGGVRSVFVRKNSDADAAQIRKKQEKKQYLEA